MNDSIPQVRNIGDLRRLLQQYDGMLSPENRRLISSLIGELENGGDPQALANLAGQMQQSAFRQRRTIDGMAGPAVAGPGEERRSGGDPRLNNRRQTSGGRRSRGR